MNVQFEPVWNPNIITPSTKPFFIIFYSCSQVIYIIRYLLARLPLKLVLSFPLQRERGSFHALCSFPHSNHFLCLASLPYTLFVYNISEKSENNVYSPHPPQTTCSPPPPASLAQLMSTQRPTQVPSKPKSIPKRRGGSKKHIEV